MIYRQLILTIAFALSLVTVSAAQTVPLDRPNIVILNLDDADSEMLSDANLKAHYPVLAELATRSVTFTNAHSTTPFCAPSRAAFFTGKYAHNNGCKIAREGTPGENGFTGGYERFKKLGHDRNELGVWMKQAGYRTIHIGKYHHSGFDYQVPAGWDDFSASLGAKYFGTSKFSNVSRTPARPFPIGLREYITHSERDDALLALERQFNRDEQQPFLMYLAPLAPHTPLSKDVTRMVEPQYSNYAADLKQPTNDPAYDESDISDKPQSIQRPPLSESEKAYCQRVWISRLRSMKSVDDMLGAIVNRIETQGQLDNTWFFITSDNGYSLGHHRQIAKKDPYNYSSHIPMIVAGPRKSSKTNDRVYAPHLLAHIDVCPTVLKLAGAVVPNDLDGKSFAPVLLRKENVEPRNWRRSVMIENWNDKTIAGRRVSMAYTAERFYDSMHIGWANGEHEFYDLRSDPYQLKNRFESLPEEQQQSLVNSLKGFRKDSPPVVTMLSPANDAPVTGTISYAGYMEDNSVPVFAMLSIQSTQTSRYFNGDYWQEKPAYIRINPDSDSTSISRWSHVQQILSQSDVHSDVLISSVTPVDDEGNAGATQIFKTPVVDRLMFSKFSSSLNGKLFDGSQVILSGDRGKISEARVAVTIVDAKTGLYFNGEKFQNDFCTLDADLQPNFKWDLTLELPSGSYRSTTFALRGAEYQRKVAVTKFGVL